MNTSTWKIAHASVFTSAVFGITTVFAQTITPAKIAFLMPDQASTRYEQHDRPGFVAEMKKLCPACEVLYQNASGDASRQQQQFNSVISQGARAIVLDPVDSTAAASLVKAAQAKGGTGIDMLAYSKMAREMTILSLFK